MMSRGPAGRARVEVVQVSPESPASRYRDLLPGILFAIALVLFTTRISVPGRYIYDEVYHAYTAGQYVEWNTDAFVWHTKAPRTGVAYMWNHPPMGVLLIAGGILVWGDEPVGWRFSSALFGAIGVSVVYLFALALTRRVGIALLAALFVMLDGLYFTQSRTAMLDIFGTVFMLCAFWALYRYLTSPVERARNSLPLVGLFLGLAIATKWNGAYAATLIGLVVLGRAVLMAVRSSRANGPGIGDKTVRVHAAWILISLAVIPATVYMTSYVPFFLAGHGAADFVELQRQILVYHSKLEDSHAYQSSWWQWPLALRSVWYHVTYRPGTVAHIYASGNPFLYWVFLPAVAWVVWMWRRGNPAALTVLLIGFFGQWLPWAAVPRIVFAYHFLPASMFGCLATAVCAAKLMERGRVWGIVAVAFVALVVFGFVFFYPIHSALPLSRDAFEMRMWLDGWR
jgi:dolichyl-phosphate-mannose--protein O-mannosyl transferase